MLSKGGFTLATLGGNFGRRRDFRVLKLLGDATFGDRKIPNLSCVAEQLDGSKSFWQVKNLGI